MGTKRPWRRWRMIVLMMALLVLPASTTGGVSAQTALSGGVSAQTALSCSTTYTLVAQWSGAFLAEVVVRNTGTSAISGWKASWTYLNGQVVTGVTSSTFTQTGANVIVTNVVWNGTIAPGGTQGGGVYIQGNWSGVNNPPVNVACTPK